MKTINIICSILVTILMASCSSKNDKFTGKWSPVEPKYNFFSEIKKEKDTFILITTKPELQLKPIKLIYDEQRDCLTGESLDGGRIQVKYIPETKHLHYESRGGYFSGEEIEYKKGD